MRIEEGRIEAQPTAGLAPYKLADPVLKGRSLRQSKDAALDMPRTEKLKCC